MDDDACYRVFCARDGRFDGRIFIGVHTTGIYCRPICPAPPPKRVNVSFFDTAVAAQQAGFRPCLRCRPEVSPRFAAWSGSSSTVSRALRLIEAGALDDVDVEIFAERLGVGARQLRRLFIEHVGAPPTAFAQMRRVHLAKQLLQESQAPITEIALAAGYRSVRRFNEAFAEAFGRSPGQFRRAPGPGTNRLSLRLGFAPPYDWTTMLDALAQRAIDGVEAVAANSYHRTVREGTTSGTLSVRQMDERTLEVELCSVSISALPNMLARLRTMLDVGADPTALASRFSDDARLGQRLAARPGIRVMGPWDAFEHVVRTAVGRGVAAADAAIRMAAFVRQYGEGVSTGVAQLTHLFPTPERVAEHEADCLLPDANTGVAIRAYAQAAASGRPPLSVYDTLANAIASLRALPGFDDQLAARCASGFLHPTDHVGDLSEDHVVRYEHWRPWRAYAVALDQQKEVANRYAA